MLQQYTGTRTDADHTLATLANAQKRLGREASEIGTEAKLVQQALYDVQSELRVAQQFADGTQAPTRASSRHHHPPR